MTLTEKALGRIIWQYRNGQNFRSWITHYPDIGTRRISRAANQIVNLINIDTARGEQLDICGRIVGIGSRPMIRSDELEVFAYNGTAGAQPYGVAPYKGPGVEPESFPLPNYLYRVVIRAKIVKNTSPATVDDIKRGVEFILGAGFSAVVVDNQDMTMRIILNQEPAFNVKAILELFDVVPRPQGVSVEYVTSGNNFSQSGELGGDPLGSVALGGAL